MKTVKKQLLTLFALTGICTGLVAYEWDFMNTTDMPILLKMETRKLNIENYYALIPPKQSVKFALHDAYCFLRASWALWEKDKKDWFGNKVPYNSGFDLVTKSSEPLYITKTDPKTGAVISKELIENTIAIGRIEGQIGGVDKQRIMGDKVGPAYSYSRMEVVMIPNELFKETVKATVKLLKGIDKTVCQVINETKSFMGVNAAENLGTGLGGDKTPPPTSETPPATPENEAVEKTETQDENTLKSNLLRDLGNLLINQKNAFANKAKNPSAPEDGKKAILAFVNDPANAALLKKIFTSAVELNKVKQGFNISLNQAAIDLVNREAGKLTTKLDIDGSIINTSLDGDGAIGPKFPLKDPEKCSFGLADIGAAGGKLAGITLCGHRQFEIMHKLNKDGDMQFDAAGNPVLQLITNEGE